MVPDSYSLSWLNASAVDAIGICEPMLLFDLCYVSFDQGDSHIDI